MQEHLGFLKASSAVVKIAAWIFLFFGIIGGIVVIAGAVPGNPRWMGVLVLAIYAFLFSFYLIAKIADLLIKIISAIKKNNTSEARMKEQVSHIKYQVVLFFALFFISLVLTGCDKLNFLIPKKEEAKKAAPAISVKGTLIAKVNNIPLTLEELNEEIDAYNAIVPADKPEAKITNREQKINYLKSEMVRRTLLYQDALDRGLDKSEDVQKALEKIKQNLLVSSLVRQEAEKVDVSSKEVENYYNTYKEQLKAPEERDIREIMVSTEPEAKDIMIQLLQGGDFATLAKERSKSESAKDGGDLGFIQKGKSNKPAQFDNVAFSDSLEVGRISSIFKGPSGYYILKLEAKRGGQQKSLSDLWDDIKKGLTFLKQQQKIEDLVGKLSSAAKIEIYEGEVK